MGALLAVLAEVVELASVTGLSVESFLSGEAFATAELLEAHIANLVTVGGLTEAEALAATEVSAEAYAALTSLSSTFPQAFTAVAATELATTGTLTVGATVAAALYPYYYDYSTPVANLNRGLNPEMALQLWFPEIDYEFPGLMPFVRFINYIDPTQWATNLFETIGRYFWESAQRYGQNLIAHEVRSASRELATRTAQGFSEAIARYFENARWAVSMLPRSLYSGLQSYYEQLPSLNPMQVRDLHRRLGQPIPNRIALEEQAIKSAEYVQKVEPPGGANQRIAPDWLLPLILGLYGDISPSWESTLEDIEEEEDAPQKKKRKRSKKNTSRSA
ncbi:VP2 [Saimiri sciureus polyomavirus 1]|uniref:Minor capsid protein n=1 Tax=Saimiri sciureus polyomavirus 1 TaxID=1236410 RepID=K7QJ86_9POLY|nr:VP2 [Saimiri sciureus polyomavirus 1]AFU25618.1 VP2 [Saimiri sciureus polyomavirus 1]